MVSINRAVPIALLSLVLLILAVPSIQVEGDTENPVITEAYYAGGAVYYSAESSDTHVWAWIGDGAEAQLDVPEEVVNGKVEAWFPAMLSPGKHTLHLRDAADPARIDTKDIEVFEKSFSLETERLSIGIGKVVKLASDGVVKWTSDSDAVSISYDGSEVTIVGKEQGKAVISAWQKNNLICATCEVFVGGEMSITPEKTEVILYPQDAISIGVELKGLDPSDVVVSSTRSSIVSVSEGVADGKITLNAKAVGSATISIYYKFDTSLSTEIKVSVINKPEIKVLNTYNFFIQITKDFDKADCRPYTEADLRSGITISAEAYNAAEALEKACRDKGIDYSAYSGSAGSQDLKGWINSMFGLKQYQGPEDMSLWTYWAQYKDWSYNQWTLGYYTEGGDFQIIWKTTDVNGNDVPSGGESGKTEVKTDENGNKVTTTTDSEKKEDGTTVSSKTETVVDKDGNLLSKTETKTEERPDGSKTSNVEKTENIKKDDGTEAVEKTGTETVTDKDGNVLSKTETSDTEEKRPDGTVVKTNTENVVEKDSSGKVLNETRMEKTEETGAGGTVISESFEKKENGKSTESRNIVSKAADGSVETEVEATVVDGKVEKAESTTVIAPSEGKVGADAAKAAVERSADAISRAGIDAKDVEKTFEVSGASVSVEPGALGAIADHGAGLRFSASEKDSVHLDGDACRSLSGQEGAIDLSMSEGQEKDLLDAQKGAVGDRFFIVLDAVVGDKRIHDLGGKASVSFGYTPAEGENVSKLRVWYVDDEGAKHVVEGSLYDPEMGGFTMELTHFSVYMVAEDSSAPSPEPEPSGDDDEGSGSSSIAIAAIAVVIIAAIVAVAVIRMRKA